MKKRTANLGFLLLLAIALFLLPQTEAAGETYLDFCDPATESTNTSDYLVYNGFEATGIESGWSESAGGVNWDDNTPVYAGSESLSGTGDYAIHPGLPNSGVITRQGWFYLHQTNQRTFGFYPDSALRCGFSTAGTFELTVDAGAQTNQSYSSGAWYNLVCVADYVNGNASMYAFDTNGDLVSAMLDHTVTYAGNLSYVSVTSNELNADNIRIYNGQVCPLAPGAPPAPNASNHSTETLSKQVQFSNITLNSVTYSTIQSHTFTPTYNNTNFYQAYTIPVNPTASNTLTCRIQIDGATLGNEHSRTNTAGEIGSLLIKSTNTTLNADNTTVDLQCKRTGGGSMELFNIVGIGHQLKDIGTGGALPYSKYNFTNTTSSANYAIIQTQSYTTNNSNAVAPLVQNIILEWTATATNNAGATEILNVKPYMGSTNCSQTIREVASGASASIGGACALTNVTNNTAYNLGFYASGTSASYTIDWDVKEIIVETTSINQSLVTFDKAAETGWNNLSSLNVDQDISAGQDIWVGFGLSANGTAGPTYYEFRLGGDNAITGNQTYRETGSWGVLGIHDVFETVPTGNYTVNLWAEVTNLDLLEMHMLAYEAASQQVTQNEFLITAERFLNNASITTFNVTIADNTYETDDGTLELVPQGVVDITFNAPNYQPITYTNINTSANNHTGYLCEVYLAVQEASDTNGNAVSYPYNMSFNNSYYNIVNNTDYLCLPLGLEVEVATNVSGWHEHLSTQNYTPSATNNYTATNMYNTNMTFTGVTSGNLYNVLCSVNGSYFTRHDSTHFTFYNDTTNMQCDEATQYPAFNQSIDTSSLPASFVTANTINVSEYTLTLTWDQNVTGYVKWIHDTDLTARGQYPYLDNTTGYDVATFQWIRVKATWPDETLVTVIWNNKTTGNNTAQYYEYRVDEDAQTSDNLIKLNKLDGEVWFNVQNYGQEELIEATIRIETCPDDNHSNCEVAGQLLTKHTGGTASPGTIFWLDTDLDYWVTISKEGYETLGTTIRGLDLVDGQQLEIKLKPTLTTHLSDYILTPLNKYHSNDTIYVLASYAAGGTFFWNTNYNSDRTQATFFNGGAWFFLTAGTDYNWSNDVTINLWTYNSSSGSYTLETSETVYYRQKDDRNLLAGIGNNNTFRVILWIFLIALASVLGAYITRDGVDTGFYVFAGGAVLLGFLVTQFIPIAVTLLVMGAGSLAFSVSRE